MGSVPYKLLLDASSDASHQLEQIQEEVPRLRKEVLELQSTRQEREDALMVRLYHIVRVSLLD